jgi:hypothetical protein
VVFCILWANLTEGFDQTKNSWVACGMTFPIALSTSPSSPSYVSAPRIGLVPPVPQYMYMKSGILSVLIF